MDSKVITITLIIVIVIAVVVIARPSLEKRKKIESYVFISIGIGAWILSFLESLGFLHTEFFEKNFYIIILALMGLVLTGLYTIISDLLLIDNKLEKTKLENILSLKNELNPNIDKVAGSYVNDILKNVERIFKRNAFYLDDMDAFIDIYKKTLLEYPKDVFFATSIPSKEFFWKYSEIDSAIAKFIEEGGKMKRIFFIENNDELYRNEVQNILRKQKNIGVSVYTLGTEHIPPQSLRNLLFFVNAENKIGWQPNRGPGDKITGIRITSSIEDTQRYLDNFKQLLDLPFTRPYTLTYIGLDPHILGGNSNMNTSEFKNFELSNWQKSCEDYHKYFKRLTSCVIDELLDSVSNFDPASNQDSEPSLLDIATGPGYVAVEALKKGFFKKIIGIDFSSHMVAYAKKITNDIPDNNRIEFQKGDAENLGFREKTFNAAIINFGILHLSKPERSITEVFRVLKHGGKFAFTAWDTPDKSRGFAVVLQAIETFGENNISIPEGPPFFYFGDQRNCIKSLTDAGFTDMDVQQRDLIWSLDSGEDLFNAFYKGTARTGGLLRAQPPDNLWKIKDSIIKSAEKEFKKSGHLEIPMSIIIASAKKQ